MKKNSILKLSVVIMLSLSFFTGFGTTSEMLLNTQQVVHAAVVEQKMPDLDKTVTWSATAPSHDKVHESVDTPLHLKEAERLSGIETKRRKK
ncbi:hypothetical protein [Listeria rustica]|uniref:Uncharacterized protein n=1 Tax=Listeria rustica TaxID=2713503 RepID=A0A7W1T7K6_9LIST|nr:hypothetical protein [Listeria rustica]MBA3926879.1 hypothetical protein [Listeria rustica]